MEHPAKPDAIDRRSFVRTLSAAGAGLTLGPFYASAHQFIESHTAPTRYALVGTGSRSQMYRTAILRDYKETAELVGLCDSNAGARDVQLPVLAGAHAGQRPVNER